MGGNAPFSPNNGKMGYLDNYMFDGEYITWTTDGANAGTVFYYWRKYVFFISD